MGGGVGVVNVFNSSDLHDIVEALATAMDAKNSFTSGHSERVANYSLLLAQRLGLSASEQTRIHIGAHLHDIGKIGIPDAILNKSGRLTDREFSIIRQHPVLGENIVSKVKILHSIAAIVRHHHERFDGNGYPDGISGYQISLGARIVAVADALDAMISARPYRPALSFADAIAEIRRCRGGQFDPDVVEALLGLVDKRKIDANANKRQNRGMTDVDCSAVRRLSWRNRGDLCSAK